MNDFNSLYNFVTGPLVWITFIVFICGSVFKIWSLISLVNRKEKFIYSYISWKYSIRSIIHWLIPFAAYNWRLRPVLTVVTFAFHFGLVCMPLFLSAHVLLINEAWGISWYTLPDGFADAMTVVVIACCVILLLRRLVFKEVRFVSTASDYLMLAIAAAPFITGFLAYHQCCSYRLWVILHIISGEIMLMVIPFSRLTHMLYAIFTRAYLGSEFGGVRHARDY